MKRVFFLALMFCAKSVFAQFYVGVKFMGITFHTDGNQNGALYTHSLGKHNRVALNFGVAITAEYFFYQQFSVKYDQALFRDCAGKFAGCSMFNLRYTLDMNDAGVGSVGMGPFFYYRKNWKTLDGYKDDGYFRESPNGKWQRKFVWYGGEFEYDHQLEGDFDLSLNLFPGYPVVYALTPGLRYRLY